ncbi:tRNA-dihydrouridine synthase [Leptospira sp. 96542]|nr:tRNA-dihydrouridine synthase [Leptospira sp. 96542]
MSRILLAPMEGLLDFRLRETITNIGGIDECVSEFIRVNDSLLPKHRIFRTVPELLEGCKTKSGVPVKVQILGSDVVCMAENAANIAALGAFGIDINFGCPAPTVNRNRGGAVLLKEPETLYQIVQAVRRSVPPSIPVTAKMRLGYDSTEHTLDCARALEAGGAEEIVVHARTKTDGYKPPAYWEWIGKIKNELKIPVVANGEIWTVEDAKRCQKISGCSDIMIGRGAIANPNLALEICGKSEGQMPWDSVVKILHSHWLLLCQDVDGKSRSGRVKQLLKYLAKTYPEANESFERLKHIMDPKEFEDCFFYKQHGFGVNDFAITI